jgi:glycerate kinase
LLTRRLERLAQVYLEDNGVDVTDVDGAGAAGGLAGGLLTLGARIVAGFEVVADALDLAGRIEGADLVITGEGFLDAQSFEGKVVGGVVDLATEAGVPVLAVAGEVYDGADQRVESISLSERYGSERSHEDVLGCIDDAVTEWLGCRSGRDRRGRNLSGGDPPPSRRRR